MSKDTDARVERSIEVALEIAQLRERLTLKEIEYRKLLNERSTPVREPAPGARRGPVVRRGQLPSRVLAYFQNHPTEVFTTDEVAEALGLADRAASVRAVLVRLKNDERLETQRRGRYRLKTSAPALVATGGKVG